MIAEDGGYAARLTRAAGTADRWFPERWTLDGPEPYAVPLPGRRPEAAETEVQPMADGRVLVRRAVADRHEFSLVYPTGPTTGEVRLGALEHGPPSARWSLLPPAPGGTRAYALGAEGDVSRVWLVAGGAGPELVAEVPGRCSGGAWLDRTGRLLALDRELAGRTKAVSVDLGQGGAASPLLQIARDSTDRVLLADPDSGLLLIRSDAPSPGRERLGWGVLGSTLPVRFPECLRLAGRVVTPFAVQPGQALAPEECGVALRIDGPGGSWPGVWRPAERTVRQLRPPQGWLAGSGLWTREGELRLPYATRAVPCGVARLTPAVLASAEPVPVAAPPPVPVAAPGPVPVATPVTVPVSAPGPVPVAAPVPVGATVPVTGPASMAGPVPVRVPGQGPGPSGSGPLVPRPSGAGPLVPGPAGPGPAMASGPPLPGPAAPVATVTVPGRSASRPGTAPGPADGAVGADSVAVAPPVTAAAPEEPGLPGLPGTAETRGARAAPGTPGPTEAPESSETPETPEVPEAPEAPGTGRPSSVEAPVPKGPVVPGPAGPVADGVTLVRCATGSGVWPGAGAVVGATGTARPVPLQQSPLTGRVPLGG
ncbi:hypothetical protein JNUCC64_25050 [Streptomyces sp. JNUCC 64]